MVVTYIHDRLFDPALTVTAIKKQFRLNDHNFSGYFAWYMGNGVKQYIDGHRLEMAKRLLCLDTLKVSEVAHAVGYRSHSAFSKAFRRSGGCTPSDFRERFRKTERDLSSNDGGRGVR